MPPVALLLVPHGRHAAVPEIHPAVVIHEDLPHRARAVRASVHALPSRHFVGGRKSVEKPFRLQR